VGEGGGGLGGRGAVLLKRILVSEISSHRKTLGFGSTRPVEHRL
jgi:hypothetical protein